MRPTPASTLFKNQSLPVNQIMQTAMLQQMHRQPNMPTQISRPTYKPIPPSFKIPTPPLHTTSANSIRNSHSNFAPQVPINHYNHQFTSKTYVKTHPNQKGSTENLQVNHLEVQNRNQGFFSYHDLSSMNYSQKGRNMHQTYQQNFHPIHPQTHTNSFNQSVNSVPIRHNLAQNKFGEHQTFNAPQSLVYESATNNMNLEILDLLLFSNFPLLTPKDQIYIPVVNRLENGQTKKLFKELYVNIKFLVVQPDEIFWKYLKHLHESQLYGLSDKEVFDGCKLRLCLESCLTNFTVKEFNKCVSIDDLLSCASALSKKIYQFEESQSFEVYQRLVDTVFQFYSKIMKTTNQDHIQIIVSSWYIDTVKIIELSIIYGHKNPQKVKKLIKGMFTLRQTLFNHDFSAFLQKLHQYIENFSPIDHGNDQISLLESLTKKIDPKASRPSNSKSIFKDFELYSIREIFYLCSQCLKLFMIVTNVFKFFPSHCKLIVMENVDFIRTVLKLAIRVIYNLRDENVWQKRRWKIPKKFKPSLKHMEFILMEKITEMLKYIFLNSTNALDQEIDLQLQGQLRSKQRMRELRNKIKFYKRIVQATANRKKQKQKESSSIEQKANRKDQMHLETNFAKSSNGKELANAISKGKSEQTNTNMQEGSERKLKINPFKSGIYNDVEFLSEDSIDELEREQSTKILAHQEVITRIQTQKKKEKVEGNPSAFKNYSRVQYKNQKAIPQEEYGKILLRHLLQKQMKQNFSKYQSRPYFYSQKLLNYCSQEYQAYLQQNKNDSSSESIQHASSFEALYKFVQVAADFQQSVRKQLAEEVLFNKKYCKLDMLIKKLPTFQEFKLSEQRKQLKELMLALNVKNKEYEDQPNEEQEIEYFWDNLFDEQDFTNLQVQFNQSNSSLNFNQKPQQKHAENETQELLSEEIIDFEAPYNAASITSMDLQIFKPHDSMRRVTNSMAREEIETFEKYKNLNWHEISRVSFLKEKKEQKINSSKDSSLIKYNNMIKVADIGLSFDMELAIEDDDDESGNMTKLSHFYYIDRKRKSFMEDYSFEEHGSIEYPNKEQHEQDQMEEQEQSKQSKVSRFKKSVKVMYVPKAVNINQSSSRPLQLRIPKESMNLQSCSRDYQKNFKSVNDTMSHHIMSPFPMQTQIIRCPQSRYSPYQSHQVNPYAQSIKHHHFPMNQTANCIKMPISQENPNYNPVLPANISILNLSHQQCSSDIHNPNDHIRQQTTLRHLTHRPKSVAQSDYSNCNRQFNYQNLLAEPKTIFIQTKIAEPHDRSFI